MARDGGPIGRLEDGRERIMGRDVYSAHAYLKPSLTESSLACTFSVDLPDGAGEGADLDTARFRAISEAIERWALRDVRLDAGLFKRLCFDYDPSSNGMSAFPGLFRSSARRAALREAIERHCLILWWEGKLMARQLPDPFRGIRAAQIENPFSRDSVVLVWRMVRQHYYVYGFGLGKTHEHAAWRAVVECHRMSGVVGEHYARRHNMTICHVEAVENLFERRALYYSLVDGFEEVLRRLEDSRYSRSHYKSQVLVDEEVRGEWSRYATVWRVVYEQPNRDFISRRTDYFFW